MKKLVFAISIAVLAVLIACTPEPAEQGQEDQQMQPEGEETTSDQMEMGDQETTAQTLWVDIRGRDQWSLMPGTTEMQEGKSPHGAFLTTRINQTGLDAINDGLDAMPDGAIVTKENYGENQEYLKLTAMAKRDGEWYWMVYSPEGEVMNEGAIDSCIQCHNGAAKDQLFYWKDE